MNPPTFAKKRKPPATAELTTCLHMEGRIEKKTEDCLIYLIILRGMGFDEGVTLHIHIDTVYMM